MYSSTKELQKLTDLSRILRAKKCKVSGLAATERQVTATVKCEGSSRTHNPIIFFDGTYSCDCEDFVHRHKFCKHLVALYLAMSDEARKKFLDARFPKAVLKIPLSVSKLNRLMEGGVPLNIVLTICGPSKAGKTWLASQIAFEVSSALNLPSIYIDTEGFFVDDTVEKYRRYFKRFARARVEFHQLRDPYDFLDLIGVRAEIRRKGDTLQAFTQKAREIPALDLMRETGARVLVIDSLTYPLKSLVPFEQQNLSARANIINAVYSQLDYIASAVPALVVIIQHVSFNPMKKQWKLWGGSSMMYLVKYALFVQRVDENKRRITRFVWPGLPQDSVELTLRRDYGYADR